MTAILIILRHNRFRGLIAETTGGKLEAADHLAHIAEQFGSTVEGNPYLRTARNSLKMSDVAGKQGPHVVSEVLTGAMFDILLAFSNYT